MVTTLPVVPPLERSSTQTKPTRTMTHLLHAAPSTYFSQIKLPTKTKPLKKPHSKHGSTPVDAEELTLRLEAYLLSQKSKSDERKREQARLYKATLAAQAQAQKRKEKEEKEREREQKDYHHVPSVAATAFERTTTPDIRRGTGKNAIGEGQKLSEAALKAHLELLEDEKRRLKSSASVQNLPKLTTAPQKEPTNKPIVGRYKTLQRTKAIDAAMLEKDRVRSRNQWQWTASMEAAADLDSERNIYKLPKRSFRMSEEINNLLGRVPPRTQNGRPLSTGDPMWDFPEDSDENHFIVSQERERADRKNRTQAERARDINDHRNDWAQRDELIHEGQGRKGGVRKKESSWILLGRRSWGNKSPKEEGVSDESGEEGGDGGGGKRGGRFLARFRRWNV